MKKMILFVFLFGILILDNFSIAQTVQAGIFSSGSTLTIKAKPSGIITGSTSEIIVTIKYLTAYAVTISAPIVANGFVFSLTATQINLDYTYKAYTSFTPINIAGWASNSENSLFSVDITGGTGTGTFEIANDQFSLDNIMYWYFEVGGSDWTNYAVPLYQPSTANVPLPVELTTFTGTTKGSNVELNWKTATEVDNFGFEIQRSTDKNIWSKVGFVQGYGNSNSVKEYSFVDNQISQSAKFHYRLKQIDTDGTFDFSNEIEIKVNAIPKEYSLDQNYPNPFNPSTTIRYELPAASRVNVKIFSIIGEQVAELVNEVQLAGFYNQQWNASNLPSGIYLLKIEARELQSEKSFSKVLKMMLVK